MEADTKRQEEVDRITARKELSQRIRRFYDYAKTDHDKRCRRWDSIRAWEKGEHWTNDDDPTLPAIRLTWLHKDSTEAAVARRKYTPKIVPEEASNFPIEAGQLPEWLQLKQKLVAMVDARFAGKRDNEIHAELLNAAVDYYRDKSDWEAAKREARNIAITYGTAFIHTGFDGQLELFGECPYFNEALHPSRVIADPKATKWYGNSYNGRFCFVKTPMTWREAKRQWPKSTKDRQPPDQEREPGKAPDLTDTEDQNDREVDIYCVFIRNEEIETRKVEVMDEVPVGVDPMTGQPITIQVPREETEEYPKYKGGWQKVYWMPDGDLLLSEDDDYALANPSGRLPIHKYGCFTVDGEIYDQGVPDLVKSPNFLLNKFLKYILDNAQATSNNQIIHSDAVDAKQFANLPGNRIAVSGNPTEQVNFIQGLPVADSYFRIVTAMQEYAELITGRIDLRQANNLPTNASGRFVEGVEGASEARILKIVANEQACERSVIRELAETIMSFEDEPKNYTLRVDGQPKQIDYAPAWLGLEGVDFEARWDVAIDGAVHEPMDPMAKNRFRLDTLKELAQMPPTLAMGGLELVDLPAEERVKEILTKWFQEQAQQAQNAPPMDPQEQAKAAGQAAKDFTQAMQDVSKALSDSGRADLAVAVQFAAVPVSFTISQGQVPDLSNFLAQVAQINQAISAMGMGGPVAPLMPQQFSGPIPPQ